MNEPSPDMADVIPASDGLRLARHAAFHIAIALLALSLFAAADSWFMLSGLGLAQGMGVITGVLAGLALPTLVHEWFHYFGARVSGGSYTIPDKLGLFVYDWKFEKNSVRQFYVMSIGGTIGSLIAIYFLFSALPPESVGRATLLAASVGSLGFAGAIEWPVLWRTRSSGNPLAELSKIDLGVLRRSAAIGGIVGLICYNLIF